jgi:hypothetical protein
MFLMINPLVLVCGAALLCGFRILARGTSPRAPHIVTLVILTSGFLMDYFAAMRWKVVYPHYAAYSLPFYGLGIAYLIFAERGLGEPEAETPRKARRVAHVIILLCLTANAVRMGYELLDREKTRYVSDASGGQTPKRQLSITEQLATPFWTMANEAIAGRGFGASILAVGAGSGSRGEEAPKPAAGDGSAAPTPMTAAVPVFSSDLAAGKKWTASSQMQIWAESGKITDEPRNQILFHTKEDDSPWLRIDLERPTRIASVDILNRQDCCGERAVPLVVELSDNGKTWRTVARRDEPFTEWKATFSARDALYVRLRVPRKTYLHLQGIGIHGPGRIP